MMIFGWKKDPQWLAHYEKRAAEHETRQIQRQMMEVEKMRVALLYNKFRELKEAP